jgi:indolepyruvate ferredoxin oxidoreductase
MPHAIKYAFQMLALLKFLRCTVFDPFGYSMDRKHDRRILIDFKSDIETVLQHVSPENLTTAIELLNLPEHIRGYGHIRRKHVDEISGRHAKLIQQLKRETLKVVNLVEAVA